jgi:ribosome-binding factor A
MKRVAESIKQELGEIIDREITDPAVPEMVTIHSVKVSNDLSVAHAYVTFLGDDSEEAVREAVAALNRAAGYIRGLLGRRVSLKYLPELHFHYNPSTRYAAKMEEIFKELEIAPEEDEAETEEG